MLSLSASLASCGFVGLLYKCIFVLSDIKVFYTPDSQFLVRQSFHDLHFLQSTSIVDMPHPDDPYYCSQQISIPPELPDILKQFTKAAIRTQPKDVLAWSAA